MKRTELNQPVTVTSLDSKNKDIDVRSEQSIVINTEEVGKVWVNIIHDGQELSMSFENFLKLRLLMHNAANEFSGIEQTKPEDKNDTAEKYLEMILGASESHTEKLHQLQMIVDMDKEGSKIMFQGKDGNQAELPDRHREGFLMGIKIAIETIDKFPIKITRS